MKPHHSARLLLATVLSLAACPLSAAETSSALPPEVAQQLDASRNFTPTEAQVKSAQAMLDELLKWTVALKGMRS